MCVWGYQEITTFPSWRVETLTLVCSSLVWFGFVLLYLLSPFYFLSLYSILYTIFAPDQLRSVPYSVIVYTAADGDGPTDGLTTKFPHFYITFEIVTFWLWTRVEGKKNKKKNVLVRVNWINTLRQKLSNLFIMLMSREREKKKSKINCWLFFSFFPRVESTSRKGKMRTVFFSYLFTFFRQFNW